MVVEVEEAFEEEAEVSETEEVIEEDSDQEEDSNMTMIETITGQEDEAEASSTTEEEMIEDSDQEVDSNTITGKTDSEVDEADLDPQMRDTEEIGMKTEEMITTTDRLKEMMTSKEIERGHLTTEIETKVSDNVMTIEVVIEISEEEIVVLEAEEVSEMINEEGHPEVEEDSNMKIDTLVAETTMMITTEETDTDLN
jgi:hypothetical protein